MSGNKKRRASWCGRNAKKGKKKAEQAEQVLYDTVNEGTEVKRSLQKELGAADVDTRPEDILAIPREVAGEFWEFAAPIRIVRTRGLRSGNRNPQGPEKSDH